MFKRVFLLVLDGCGIGSAPDAEEFGDKGANTLLHTLADAYNLDVLERIGLTTLVGYEAFQVHLNYMHKQVYVKEY